MTGCDTDAHGEVGESCLHSKEAEWKIILQKKKEEAEWSLWGSSRLMQRVRRERRLHASRQLRWPCDIILVALRLPLLLRNSDSQTGSTLSCGHPRTCSRTLAPARSPEFPYQQHRQIPTQITDSNTRPKGSSVGSVPLENTD